MPPRKIPKQYLPKGLTKQDRAKQKKSIEQGKMRPKVESFKSKRSSNVVKFEKKYGVKGRGAYFSSGSRPNQTPESWARGRLASVIMNGPARKVDKDIWEKYKR